jgi:hypothetical protein
MPAAKGNAGRSHLPYRNVSRYNAGAIPDFVCATSTNSSVTADTKTEKTIYSKSKTFRTAVALMTRSPNLKFLSHNAILKNAILALAEYGEITVDLVIKMLLW